MKPNPEKYKIVGDTPGVSFEREFSNLRTMRQYQKRNPYLKAKEFVFHADNWERFVIYGSQVIPESVLHSLLKSLNLGQ